MNNRTRILQEALSLFCARGYDAVGVQEIAEAAEVTKPTLYHYFGNKQGLLQELIDRYMAELQDLLGEAADYRGDLPLTLNRTVNAFFEFAMRRPEYYRFQLALWFAPPESESGRLAAWRWEKLYTSLETLFRRAEADHGNMRGRSRMYAFSFLGVINSYIGGALHGSIKLDQELAFRAVHQFMHGIYS